MPSAERQLHNTENSTGSQETPRLLREGIYDTRNKLDSSIRGGLKSLSFKEMMDMPHADLANQCKHLEVYARGLETDLRVERERRETEEGRTFGQVKQENKDLRLEIEKLKQQVTTDTLTQIHNLRYLEEEGAKEFVRSERAQTPLTAVMVDIDHFKLVNDEHDHDFGDKVLRAVAQELKNSVRESDIAARYGGEEFTLIFSEMGTQEAWDVMERIRTKIENMSFDYKGKEVKITISAGMATFYPNKHDKASENEYNDIKELIKKADGELFEAKRSGRNRVCCAEPKIPTMYADQEYLNQAK